MSSRGYNDYLNECIEITGAVIDGDYRDYGIGYGYFTPDGTIIPSGEQHPLFELELEEIIQLEFQGSLDPFERTVEEWIIYLEATTPFFNKTS